MRKTELIIVLIITLIVLAIMLLVESPVCKSRMAERRNDDQITLNQLVRGSSPLRVTSEGFRESACWGTASGAFCIHPLSIHTIFYLVTSPDQSYDGKNVRSHLLGSVIVETLLTSELIKMVVGQAPAVVVLLYVAYQQQKLINLIIETCMRKLEDEDNSA